MEYKKLLSDIEIYINGVFKFYYNPELVYHNPEHTRNVVLRTKEISAYYSLNERDTFIVTSAAWFHDIGYISGKPSGHEKRGADLAEVFFKKYFIADETIALIRACILATILPQKPKTLLQQIICDADLYHFGTEDFIYHDELMQKEVELRTGNKIETHIWLKGTIHLMESHRFHTVYCQQLLSKNKEYNLGKLCEMLVQK